MGSIIGLDHVEEPPQKKSKENYHISNENLAFGNLNGLANVPLIFLSNTNLENHIDELSSEPLPGPSAVSYSASEETSSTVTIDSDFSLSSLPTGCIEAIDVNAILRKDFLGDALYQKGKNNTLTNNDRDRISDILVTTLLNRFKGKLTHHHFRVVSEKLVNILPGEKKTTYFIEPIQKKYSRRNKSEPARGTLIEKYRNKLHLIRKLEKSLSPEKTNSTSHEVYEQCINYDFGQIHACNKDLDVAAKFDGIFQSIYEKKKKAYPLKSSSSWTPSWNPQVLGSLKFLDAILESSNFDPFVP
ncbi:hypothetical protein PPYR_02382 [Photinus pyralis]|uniref:Uncharacterized protein n=1 Tax=Photinus pyralis TaxID=7054 RepID=A0A5N4B735_PHOPY|nr:hypothetical protein PPYR_02382 [Photinus pyralis]